MPEQRYAATLRCLYGYSAVPVWLFGRDGALCFTSARGEIRTREELSAVARWAWDRAEGACTLQVLNQLEFLALLWVEEGGEERLLLAGPCFRVHPVAAGYTGRLALDWLYPPAAARDALLNLPTVSAGAFCQVVSVLLELFQGQAVPPERLEGRLTHVTAQSLMDQTLEGHLFRFREETPVPPHSYEREQEMLSCVRHGDPDRLAALPPLRVPAVQGPSVEDPFRKFLYDMIALTTLITRSAIEGGMHAETAYTLSDLYLRRLDAARSTAELVELGRRILNDFTLKVRETRDAAASQCSPPVRRCMEYVRNHLHESVSLDDAAAAAGLNAKYLSRLFLRETGRKFSSFVQLERVREAQKLLAHTDMPLQAVGATLCFSSQSYFTKVFVRYTGATPQKYREARRV